MQEERIKILLIKKNQRNEINIYSQAERGQDIHVINSIILYT